MEDRCKQVMKAKREEIDRLIKQESAIKKKINSAADQRWTAASALQLMKVLRVFGFDCEAVVPRLTPSQLCRAWAESFLWEYLGREGDIQEHRAWKRRHVRNAAYEILGRRRLPKRMKTRDLLTAAIMMYCSDDSLWPRVGWATDSEVGYVRVRYETAGFSAITDMEDFLQGAVDRMRVVGKRIMYEEYNRPRVLLAGWRKLARDSLQ